MVYLDNAATSFPKPKTVIKAVVEGIEIYGGNPGRSGHSLSMKTSNKIFQIREKFANFFNASTENVVFTSNCTTALNTAIKGVLEQKGHIICSCLEHNSVIRPIYKLSQKYDVSYSIATIYPHDLEKTLRSFAGLITKDTKAIVCTHASNVTGYILPIKQIGQLCKQANIKFIVDAAQTAGVLPINIKENNIDILCVAGHKSLMGAVGTGLIVFNDDVYCDSLCEGGTGSASAQLTQPDINPDKFESGTVNTVGILSLEAGLNHVTRIGLQKIYNYEMDLCKYIYAEFLKNPKIITYVDNFIDDIYVPIVLFNIQGLTSVETTEYLNQKGYALRGGIHCSPLAHEFLQTTESGAVRVSPHSSTTKKSIVNFVNEVKKLTMLS